MHACCRLSSSALSALGLALPCIAQVADPGPLAEPVHLAPTSLEYATSLSLPGTLSLAQPPSEGWAVPALEPEWLRVGSFPVAAGPKARGGVRRAELDAESGVAFTDLPGGIVLGLVARPELDLVAPRVRATDGRLEVVDGETVVPLPREDARFLWACLSFAASGRADDAAVDIRSDGTIDLAPEFVDTRPGVALVRCDRVPHAHRLDRAQSKSLILDRDARLRFDAASGELRPEAELEVRFARPGSGAELWLEAQPAAGALRVELADAAHVAAWVAFFRWAGTVDPDGLERVAATLALSELALDATRTPRWIPPPPSGVPASAHGPRPAVDAWMWDHRARVLQQR